MRHVAMASFLALLMALLGGETFAGKGGNGNGGGGGGGGDPIPSGRIYFAHDSGPGTDVRSVLADGSDETVESIPQSVTPADGHVSYARHGGGDVYWSLGIKVIDPGANPDGSEESVVVARADGVEVELTAAASAGERVTAVRWGKGDAFISYVAIRWTGTGAGDAAAHLCTASVSWNTGEPVLTETPVQEFEVPSRLNGGLMEADVAYFDWSPDGSKVAYELGGEIWVREPGASAPPDAVRSGTGPAWSPDGNSIALIDGGLWTMDPDGSNATRLVADGGKDVVYGAIAWSPDSADLAFLLGKRRRGSIPSGLSTVDFDLARVSASGGDPVRIIKDSESDDRVAAWRED